MNSIQLRCESVSATYGNQAQVLSGLNLEVSAGQVLGLLGPNGAGKTTLLRCILGLMPIQSGRLQLFGESWSKGDALNNRNRLARIGVLLESPGLYRKLSPEEYLRFFAALYRTSGDNRETSANPSQSRLAKLSGVALTQRIRYLCDRLGFVLDAKPCAALSQGNRQKLHLIRTLLHDPDLLLWDEPTDHLDPTAQSEALSLVTEHAKQGGRAVLLASHRIEHLEKVCDGIAILVAGRMRLSGALPVLLAKQTGSEAFWANGPWPLQVLDALGLAQESVAIPEAERPLGATGGLRLNHRVTDKIPELVAALCREGYRILQVTPIRPTLTALYHQTVTQSQLPEDSKQDLPSASLNSASSRSEPRQLIKNSEFASHSGWSGWRVIARQELVLVWREPRFLLPFVLTSLFLVGAQAFILLRGMISDPEEAFNLAQPIFLLLGVLGPALCVPLAADAFAGEKERNTLDLLLCAPPSAQAIFLGKVMGMLPFPIAFAWLGQGLMLALLVSRGVDWMAHLGVFALTLASAPVLAFAVSAVAVAMSLRAETVRAATQSLAPFLFVAFVGIPLVSPWLFLHPQVWAGILLLLVGLSVLSFRRLVAKLY